MHIIEVGGNMKTVCKRFLDSGMTPEQVAKRMDVPIKFVNGCMRQNHGDKQRIPELYIRPIIQT